MSIKSCSTRYIFRTAPACGRPARIVTSLTNGRIRSRGRSRLQRKCGAKCSAGSPRETISYHLLHEWARFKSSDSLECRNCHSALAMDLTKQSARAADIHSRYLISGQRTCIDCHKGIAHELPDMTGIEPGWRPPVEMRDRQNSLGDTRERLQKYLLSADSRR